MLDIFVPNVFLKHKLFSLRSTNTSLPRVGNLELNLAKGKTQLLPMLVPYIYIMYSIICIPTLYLYPYRL